MRRPDAPTGFLPDDRISGSQLLLLAGAAAVVLAVHAGGVVWALQEPPATAASDSPPPAVMIDLAPEPVAPRSEQQVITPDTTDAEEVQPSEPELPEPPPPAPLELPEPTVAPEVVEERPPARPPEPPKPKEPEKKKEEPQKKPPSQAAKKAQVDAPAEAEKAAASQTTSGGSGKVAPRAWQARLMAHLERRKRYPSAGRATRAEGTAQVRFRIDGEGNVLSAALARSSGSPALDEAAVALVQRASPVPAPPPDAPRSITMPVRYNLD